MANDPGITAAQPTEAASAETRNYPRPLVAWSTVALLSITYMFSYMDRQILVLLIEPVKRDLVLTDTEVSLLSGLAFAVVYAVMGVPLGRAADLWVRKYVIIAGVTVWSITTIFCGVARNFGQLFAARMGVGLGEAALTPTAYAIVADLFPPHKLAKAMSVFALGGVAAGSALSLFLSGAIIGLVDDGGTVWLPLFGELQPWRVVLLIVGLLSLMLVIPLALMPEPPRHGHVEGQRLPFRDVLGFMREQWRFYAPFVGGVVLSSVFTYGSSAWIPTYFIRVHGWDAAQAGMTLGALFLGPALIGGILGGWLADLGYARGYRSAPLTLKAAVLASLGVITPLFVYCPWPLAQLAMLALFNLLSTVHAVLSPTIAQMATPNRMRAQVSAIYLMASSLIGIGFGPACVALLTDRLFVDEMAVGNSIALLGAVCCPMSALLLFTALPRYRDLAAR